MHINKHVIIDPQYFRAHEVPELQGDSSKARKKFNWKPKITFNKLVELMYNSDFELEQRRI